MSGVVLLIEVREAEVLAVAFPTTEAARAWEDQHETEFQARGVVRLVTRTEALEDL